MLGGSLRADAQHFCHQIWATTVVLEHDIQATGAEIVHQLFVPTEAVGEDRPREVVIFGAGQDLLKFPQVGFRRRLAQTADETHVAAAREIEVIGVSGEALIVDLGCEDAERVEVEVCRFVPAVAGAVAARAHGVAGRTELNIQHVEPLPCVLHGEGGPFRKPRQVGRSLIHQSFLLN